VAAVAALGRLADELGASVAQLAIAWVASRGDDVVPLVGARTRARLAEALAALELLPRLDGAALAQIGAALPPEAITGTRYAAAQMAHLDSER